MKFNINSFDGQFNITIVYTSAGATVNPLWEAPDTLPVVQLQPVSSASLMMSSAGDTPLPVQVLPTNQLIQVQIKGLLIFSSVYYLLSYLR